MSAFTRQHSPQKQQGKMAWTATRIARLPVLGADSQIDRAVLAGQYRDVQLVTTPGGEQFRIARTKGQTYRKYPRTNGMKRRDHRAAARVVSVQTDMRAYQRAE